MHARIDHLLSIRDAEPVDVEIAAHVEQCSSCSAQLQRLRQARLQLQALPELDAPVSFGQIQVALARSTSARKRVQIRQLVAAVALVALGMIVFIALRDNVGGGSEPGTTPRGAQQAAAQPHDQSLTLPANVDELVAQSQRLEGLLQRLPERPRIERVSTAATIDTIEQRIQWLDFQLSYAPDSGLNDEQASRLWRERVELMDSLVKVRYAEGGVSF